MKKIIPVLLLITLGSCNTWEDKDTFRQACIEDANKWSGSEERSKTYCECVLQQMMKKYPNESDALEHIDDLSKDTSLMNCRKLIQ